jgi:Methylamine utilization protein MauJ
MPRFEAALRTAVAFRRDGPAPSLAQLSAPPDPRVSILFERREFVWHHLERTTDPYFGVQDQPGPLLVVQYASDRDARAAANSLQRLVTALVYGLDAPIEAMSPGSSGESDTTNPHGRRTPRAAVGYDFREPPSEVALRRSANLFLALGYYREAVNAVSPFYRFLAFWNCLEATFDVNRKENLAAFEAFLNRESRKLKWRWDTQFPFPREPSDRLREESRSAIAHVIRDPGRRRANPASNRDRARLGAEAEFLRHIARAAINQEYPRAVTLRYLRD